MADFYNERDRLDARDLGDYTINDLGLRAIGIASQLPNEFNRNGLSLSPAGVSGLLGNFLVEAPSLQANERERLNGGRVGPGYGLAQWTDRPRKEALFEFYDDPSVAGMTERQKQVAFVPYEMVNFPGNAWAGFNQNRAYAALNGTNVLDAVKAGYAYERPGIGHFDRRVAEANSVYDLMGYGRTPDVWSTEKPFGGALADRLPSAPVFAEAPPPDQFVAGLLGIEDETPEPAFSFGGPLADRVGPADYVEPSFGGPLADRVADSGYTEYDSFGSGLADRTPEVNNYNSFGSGLADRTPEISSYDSFGPGLADRLDSYGLGDSYNSFGSSTADRVGPSGYTEYNSFGSGLADRSVVDVPSAPSVPSFGGSLADRVAPTAEIFSSFGRGLADRIAPVEDAAPAVSYNSFGGQLADRAAPGMAAPSAPAVPSVGAAPVAATTIAGPAAAPSGAASVASPNYTSGYYVDPLTRSAFMDGERVGNVNSISPNYAVDPLTRSSYNPSGATTGWGGIVGGLLGATAGGIVGGIPGAIGMGYTGYNVGNAVGGLLGNGIGWGADSGGGADAGGGYGGGQAGGGFEAQAGGGWGSGYDSYR